MSGFDESVGVSRLLLNLLGVWPETLDNQLCLACIWGFVLNAMIIIFALIPQIMKIYIVRQDFTAVLRILSLAGFGFTVCIVKYMGIWYRKNGEINYFLQQFIL